MHESAQRLASRIEADGRKAVDIFRTLSESELAYVIYRESPAWQVREILAHLTSAQATVLDTLVSVLAGGPGLDRNMDLDAFNASAVTRLASRSASQLIAKFDEDCAALSARVAALTNDDLARRCWHPWLGDTTVEETLRLACRHTMMHLRDVRRNVARGSSVAQARPGAEGQEGGASRTGRLSLFLREAHAQSWPHIVRLAEQAGTALVYPGAPGWTVRELLAHLADAERGMLGQAQRIVRGEPALPEGFDPARWNRRAVEKRAGASTADLLAEIEKAHRDWVAFVEGLDDAALDRQGRTAEGELLTVEAFARHAAKHRMDHTCDAEKSARGGRT
jgi:uncharacterized damage-inducible protein DinB